MDRKIVANELKKIAQLVEANGFNSDIVKKDIKTLNDMIKLSKKWQLEKMKHKARNLEVNKTDGEDLEMLIESVLEELSKCSKYAQQLQDKGFFDKFHSQLVWDYISNRRFKSLMDVSLNLRKSDMSNKDFRRFNDTCNILYLQASRVKKYIQDYHKDNLSLRRASIESSDKSQAKKVLKLLKQFKYEDAYKEVKNINPQNVNGMWSKMFFKYIENLKDVKKYEKNVNSMFDKVKKAISEDFLLADHKKTQEHIKEFEKAYKKGDIAKSKNHIDRLESLAGTIDKYVEGYLKNISVHFSDLLKAISVIENVLEKDVD